MIGRVARAVTRRVVRAALRLRPVRRIVKLELARGRPRRQPRPIVEGELARGRPLRQPPPPSSGPGPVGTFIDARGIRHALVPGLRDRLKPSWRTMCDPVQVAMPPSDEALAGRARKAASNVTEAGAVVTALTGRPLAGRVLEIGCYDGAVAFQLAQRVEVDVVASDLARYYVVQRPGEPTDDAVDAQQVVLAKLRERARVVAGVGPGRVQFVEDDITRSALDPDSFDLIVTFEVLEHVLDPAGAFAAMAALLRPGGIMYHDYNPFFAVNGGHSLCTLDIPWGHARLGPEDVDRYLREIRPAERDQAIRFYTESLNRMTQGQLRAAISGAGLELLAVIPWNDRRLLAEVTPDLLDDVRRTHPDAVVDDLLGTFVAVAARRPVEAGS